jgi:hypothetical protein
VPGDPRLRASDADRERTVNLLREHHAEGRLDMDEFHERLNGAYEAKTLGDLNALLADLPGIDLYRLPSAGLKPAPVGSWAPARRPSATVARQSAQWAAWAVTSSLLGLLWVVGGIAVGGTAWVPWFLLVAVPWAIALNRRARS